MIVLCEPYSLDSGTDLAVLGREKLAFPEHQVVLRPPLEDLKEVQGLEPESQDQHLAVTVLCMPHNLTLTALCVL